MSVGALLTGGLGAFGGIPSIVLGGLAPGAAAVTHVRTQIREAFRTLLLGLSTTGQRVFVRRLRPVASGEVPCLLISGGDEPTARKETIGFPGQYLRDLDLSVEVLVETEHADGSTDLDAQFDVILAEIESRIYASTSAATLGGLLRTGLVPGEPYTEVDADPAESAIGRMRIAFRAQYLINPAQPDTAL